MNANPNDIPEDKDVEIQSGSEDSVDAVVDNKAGEGRRDEVFVKPEKPNRTKTKASKNKTVKPKREKRTAGLFTVCLAALIAAGLGTAGGGALSRVLDQDEPSFEPAQITQRLEALEADIQTVKSQSQSQAPAAQIDTGQIDALNARIAALENLSLSAGDGGVTAGDITQLSARLDELDKMVLDANTMPKSESAPNPRLIALEETVSALSEKPSLDPALEQRIEALENTPTTNAQIIDLEPLTQRIATLETNLQNASEPTDFSSFIARLDALEAKVAQASAARAALPIPEFPKDAVLAAIIEADNAAKGWAGRMLGKHVRTRDEAVINTVDEIVLLASSGQIETALSRIEQLPESGQLAAKTWTDIVSLQRTLP